MPHLPRFASTILGALVLASSSSGTTLSPPVAFSPATETQSSVEIVADPSIGARALASRAACDEQRLRTANVALDWVSGPIPASELRVDVSKLRDGFETGRFSVSEPLGPTDSAVTFERPEPGVAYYWRVVTRTDGGWVSSEVARFEVPICPWDPPDREPSGPTERAAAVRGAR